MRLSTIRKIDYWAGMPICLALDIFSWLLGIFRPRSGKPGNTLFIELSEAGSLIIAYSAIKRLKDAAPDAKLYFMIFKRHAEGLELLDIIDRNNIITIRDDSFIHFAMDVLRGIGKIWGAGIESVIDMELFSRATSVLSFLTLASNRVGFYGYTGEGLYRGVFIHNYKVTYNPYKHMSLNFMALVEALTGDEKDRPLLKRKLDDSMITPLKLPKTERAVENGLGLIKTAYPELQPGDKLVLMNPNAGELPIRAWALDNFTLTAQNIIENDEKAVVLVIGLPDAMRDGLYMEERINSPRLVNLVGATASLGDVVDLCHVSELILTNDAGPAQYAALTETNIVVIFGPETPLLYRPLGKNVHPLYTGFSCSPCLTAANHRNSVCRDNRCIQSIPVEEVTELCLSLLKRAE